MSNEITLEDIRNAIAIIKDTMPPDKWIETEFAMLKVDGTGNVKEMMLKKGVYGLLVNYIKTKTQYKGDDIIEGEIGIYEGIPIIKTVHLEDIERGLKK